MKPIGPLNCAAYSFLAFDLQQPGLCEDRYLAVHSGLGDVGQAAAQGSRCEWAPVAYRMNDAQSHGAQESLDDRHDGMVSQLIPFAYDANGGTASGGDVH